MAGAGAPPTRRTRRSRQQGRNVCLGPARPPDEAARQGIGDPAHACRCATQTQSLRKAERQAGGHHRSNHGRKNGVIPGRHDEIDPLEDRESRLHRRYPTPNGTIPERQLPDTKVARHRRRVSVNIERARQQQVCHLAVPRLLVEAPQRVHLGDVDRHKGTEAEQETKQQGQCANSEDSPWSPEPVGRCSSVFHHLPACSQRSVLAGLWCCRTYTPLVAVARSLFSLPLRVVGFSIGFFLLIGVAGFGFRSAELDSGSFAPTWLIVLTVLALCTLSIVATEFRVLARITGVEISHRTAFGVSVIGAAANLLPVPGSAITRFVVLQRAGATKATIAAVLLGGALAWLGVAGLIAGAGLAGSSPLVAAAFAAGASGSLAAGLILLRRGGSSTRNLGLLIATELTLTLVGIARFLAVAAMLALPGTVRETAALAAAGPASAAVGFVPAGLGVRESLAAALGAISGLGGAEAAVIAVVDRAVGLGILLPAAAVVVAMGVRIGPEVG